MYRLVYCQVNSFPPVAACEVDDFLIHCEKRGNGSKGAISPFATMFTFIFSNYRDFPYFCFKVFKVVCYKVAVCGKGIIKTRNITEGDEYPHLVPDNIHMYEKFKGP